MAAGVRLRHPAQVPPDLELSGAAQSERACVPGANGEPGEVPGAGNDQLKMSGRPSSVRDVFETLVRQSGGQGLGLPEDFGLPTRCAASPAPSSPVGATPPPAAAG